MSSPAEWPVNVYQIGKTDSISWTAYRLHRSTSIQGIENDSEERDEPAHAASVGETLMKLRNQGLYVCYCVEDITLWHFQGLDGGDNSDTSSNGMIDSELQAHGITSWETNQGSLKVADIVAETLHAVLYQRLTDSILLSALGCIATQPDCYSLGLHQNDRDNSIEGAFVTTLKNAGELLSLRTLRLRWYSSGELILSISIHPGSRYLLLSQVLPYVDETFLIHCQSHFTTIPTGRQAIFVGHVAPSNLESNSENVNAITRAGFEILEADVWIKLKLKQSASSAHFTWPAKLCMVPLDEITRPKDTTGGSRLLKDVLVDPIAQAVAWYDQRWEREKAIAARVQKDDEERRRKEAEQAPQGQDGHVDVRSPAAHFLSSHEASGIYPTPPDGLVHHASQPDHGANQAEDDQHTAGNGTEDSASGRFGQSLNDDLFSDLNETEMPVAGVTEDDFDFFDDPGGDDGRVDFSEPFNQDAEMSNISTLTSELHQSENVSVGDSPTDPVNALEDKLSPKLSNNLQTFSPIRAATQDFDGNLNSSTRIIDGEKGEAGELDQDESHGDQMFPKTRADVGRESSQAHNNAFEGEYHTKNPRAPNAHKLDGKYRTHGKYGYEESHQNLGTRPGISLDTTNMTLPRLHSTVPSEHDDFLALSDDSNISPTSWMETESAVVSSPEDIGFAKRQGSSQDISAITSTDQAPSHASTNVPIAKYPDLCFLDVASVAPSLFKAVSLGTPRRCTYNQDPQMLIQYAQMLIEQVIYDENAPLHPGHQHEPWRRCSDEIEHLPANRDEQTNLLSQRFPHFRRQKMQDLISVLGANESSAATKPIALNLQKRQPGPVGSESSKGACSPVDGPYVTVRRGVSVLEMTSPALLFWEELSLGPVSGEKHIHFLPVIGLDQTFSELSESASSSSTEKPSSSDPDISYVYEQIASYLRQVCDTYQSLKLGTCSVVPQPKDSKVYVPSQEFLSHCEGLGCLMSKSRTQNQTLVVVMLDTSPDCSLGLSLCEGFVRLLNAYQRNTSVDSENRYIDMVLQILPLRSMQSSIDLSISSETSCKKLAFRMYERCPARDGGEISYPFICTPSMKLAKKLPKFLQFRIGPEVASPFRTPECLHLAYTWNIESPWLTASWSDNEGLIQWNAAYHIGTSGEEKEGEIRNVISEMFETSIGLRHARQQSKWLFVVKCGPISVDELQTWQSVVQTNKDNSFLLSVNVVDLDPYVEFDIPESESQGKMLGSAAPLTNAEHTIATTPSPDPSGTGNPASGWAATPAVTKSPGSDERNHAKLVDVSNECWSVPLACPLDQPRVSDEYASYQASAYLVKRAGYREEDGMVTIAVNMLHCSGSPTNMLKELLVMYRGLVLLAGHRGVVNPVKQILPLHVAACVKAHTSVTRLMG